VRLPESHKQAKNKHQRSKKKEMNYLFTNWTTSVKNNGKSIMYNSLQDENWTSFKAFMRGSSNVFNNEEKIQSNIETISF
jgi:ectoine hydroxylase-related dioxygenase (phytanoyl-CoA dioxygenase family)